MTDEIVRCDKCGKTINAVGGGDLFYRKTYVILRKKHYDLEYCKKDLCVSCYKKMLEWLTTRECDMSAE